MPTHMHVPRAARAASDGLGAGVVAEQLRRLVDDVGLKAADVVEVAEAALGNGAALDRAHLAGIRLALGRQRRQAFLVDRAVSGVLLFIVCLRAKWQKSRGLNWSPANSSA